MKYEDGRRRVSRRSLLGMGGKGVGVLVVGSLASSCTLLDAIEADRYSVSMTDGARYEPTALTVPVGATVVWRNMAARPHTATADPDLLDDPSRVQIPAGAATWDSGEILTGDQWEYTFTQPGTYIYGCQFHQAEGMIGTITVEDGA